MEGSTLFSIPSSISLFGTQAQWLEFSKCLDPKDEGIHFKNGRGVRWLGHGFLIVLKLPGQPWAPYLWVVLM